MPELTQAYKDSLLTAPRGEKIAEGFIDPSAWRRFTFQVETVPGESAVIIGGSYFCRSNMDAPLWSTTDVLEVKKGAGIKGPLFGAFCVQHAIEMYNKKISSLGTAPNVAQGRFPTATPG